MGKQVITRYSYPLTSEEREEIKEILKPVMEEKERWEISKELQTRLLKIVSTFFMQVSPAFSSDHLLENIAVLNECLERHVREWFNDYRSRLGPRIRLEDLHVSISADGLYILNYSDTIKEIITKADFELNVSASWLGSHDRILIDEVNRYLEQKPSEEISQPNT